MNEKTKLRVAWDVDFPSVDFADRVVARAVAVDEASRWAGPDSRVIAIRVAHGSATTDGKRYRSFAVAAAAATLMLYIGASAALGRNGDSGLLEAIEREPAGEPARLRLAQDKLGRSVTNGGNTAISPEAGAGVW